MNYLTLYLPLLSAIFIFSSGFFVSFKKRTFLSFLFLMFCLSFTVWLFSAFMMLKSFSEGRDAGAIFWDRAVYIGVVFMPTLILHLSIAFIRTIKQKKLLITGYIISFIFLILSRSDYFVKDLYKYKWGCHTIAQPLHHVFLLFFWGYVSLAIVNFYKYHKRAESESEKNRTKYLLLAVFLLFSIGGLGYLPAYKIPIYPFPFLSGVIFTVIFAYTIVKYSLLDIRVVITRAGIFIVVYTLVLGLPFALGAWLRSWLSLAFGLSWWMLPLGLMALMATTGPFIYIYLNKRAEEMLFKEQRRYQDTLKRASLGMTRVRDIGRLLKLIVYTVAKSVRLNHAAIYILNKEADGYVLGSHRSNPRSAQPQAIDLRSPLIRHFLNSKKPLLLEELDPIPAPENAPRPEVCLPDRQALPGQGEPQNNFLKAQLYTLSASVVIPSFIEDDLLGFMVLGEKRSGSIYTEDDLRVFTVLANQAGLAIENARFFEIAQETQEQIAQAEKMATLGTMANGLSHQMNNRFHAMSLIASDALDSIKIFNSKNSSPEIKELLSYLEYSAERIKSNSLQGGNIVRGMLKYSRKGEPGFAGVNLDELLNATFEMLQFKIKLSEIDIERNYPQDEINLKANFTQLQEVFFNLIDNAYDAMNERKAALKEPGYRGKVNISTIIDPQNHTTRIIVQDNGLGIKEEDQKKIFTPFFTTKISNRKGTGLGLYVIKKIISENHKGRIQVSSVYQQGTTFSLDLTTADHKNSTLIKGNVEIWGE